MFSASLGETLIHLNRLEEAESLLRQAVGIFERHSRDGKNGRNACIATADLGGALLRQGEIAQAEKLLGPCHRLLSSQLRLPPRFRFRATGCLVELY